jgi:hypothetical protein
MSGNLIATAIVFPFLFPQHLERETSVLQSRSFGKPERLKDFTDMLVFDILVLH